MLRQAGLNILTHELGPVGLIRFLQQYESGIGDYSKERHQLPPSLGGKLIASSRHLVEKTGFSFQY